MWLIGLSIFFGLTGGHPLLFGLEGSGESVETGIHRWELDPSFLTYERVSRVHVIVPTKSPPPIFLHIGVRVRSFAYFRDPV